MKEQMIANINGSKILLVKNEGEKLVPIKPICEALGIDEESQRKKILDDEILSSVTVLSTATGSDKKQYKMNCLPLMYIFGWLFTINPKNVKPEAQEAVKKYRMECYTALYRYFTDSVKYLEEKEAAIEKALAKVDSIRKEFNTAKDNLNEANKQFKLVRQFSYEDWVANNRQYRLEF